MTPLSPTRRDAEAFARAVENGVSVVDGARGDVADRYGDLLTCVDVLRSQEIPAPRADFVTDLRMRLMDAADTLLVPAEHKLAPVIPLVAPASRRQRRTSIAAAAFIVIGGSAGVAAAAESALPGDALYPIKRGIESAQVSLNSSDSGKGQDLLRQASTRLDEVDGLLAANQSSDEIAHTLSSFQRSAASGADLLFVAYQRDGNPDDIARLRTMLGSQLTKLDRLALAAPDGASEAFASARALLGDLDQQASVLCSECGPGGISDGLFTMQSAPTLDSLLIGPVKRAVQAAAEARANKALAEDANEIAKGPKADDEKPAVDTNEPPVDHPTDGKPALPLPDPTEAANGLAGTVKGLTSGVSGLLGALGGPVTPLSSTLTNTLEELTNGLLK